MGDSVIRRKSFTFALGVIVLYKNLIKGREYIISRQLLRSGTSIGANVEEALAAQSRKDFISKMSIASKEARESRYWLKLLNESNYIKADVTGLVTDIEEIIKILTSIVKTTQERSK